MAAALAALTRQRRRTATPPVPRWIAASLARLPRVPAPGTSVMRGMYAKLLGILEDAWRITGEKRP
jgi:hypothetical protein